jgi:3-hydroxymyristoyl/3-hydroxydecanoyl-(acyl carrier protein) dehydratase
MADIRATEPEILAIRPAGMGVELDLAVPPGLLYFEGHFPGFAILPGIVQVDWAIRLARRYLAIGTRQPMAMQVKFRAPVQPGYRLRLVLSVVTDTRGERLSFEYRSGETIHASGKIGLGPA